MHNRAIIHGCLVAIDGVGVLVVGDAGVGKTTVCLELARLGHDFIADDAVEITRVGEVVTGSPATHTTGLVSIRGVGVISRISKGFGLSATIDLIAELISGAETIPQLTIDDMLKSILRKRYSVTESTARHIESFARETASAK